MFIKRYGTFVPFLFTVHASDHLHRKDGFMVYFIAATYYSGEKGDYAEYIQKVAPIVARYNGRYIVRSEKITPFRSDKCPKRVIIIEFDTREQLEKCFLSKEYQSIAVLRENSVDGSAFIIE